MSAKLCKYEGMFVLHNSKVNAENGGGTQLVTGLIQKHHGQPVKVDLWDERKLAYPIKDQKRATYILAHFEAPPTSVAGLSHAVNISEDVMRALVVRVEEFPMWRNFAEIDALRPRREPRRRDDESWDEGGGGGERRGGYRERYDDDSRGDSERFDSGN
ncbi:MAG: 30S ribosomal protein S6 [Planctomycetes bacterium]|nr:30S ribosomal protein S6 [Planctomycetota bacterium]